MNEIDLSFPYDDFEMLDTEDRYKLGLTGLDALFDQDPEDEPFDHTYGPTTEWDVVLLDRISDMPVSLYDNEQDEAADWLRMPQNQDPDLEKRRNDVDDIRLKLFGSYIRYVAWFTRESAGMHKHLERRPTIRERSAYGGFLLREYSGAALDFADRFQEVALGVWGATEKYTVSGLKGMGKSASFIGYSKYYAENGLSAAIDSQRSDQNSVVPQYYQQKLRVYRNELEAAENDDRLPNADYLMGVLKMELDELLELELVHQRTQTISLEELDAEMRRLGTYADRSTGEQLTSSDLYADSRATDVMQRTIDGQAIMQFMVEALGCLDERSKQVVILSELLELPYHEIGRRFNVTGPRIGQIKYAALAQMHRKLIDDSKLSILCNDGQMSDPDEVIRLTPELATAVGIRHKKITYDYR